jgi:hypothetical protein
MSSIGPVATAGISAVQFSRGRPEQAEVHPAGRDTSNDGDADDRRAAPPTSGGAGSPSAGAILDVVV